MKCLYVLLAVFLFLLACDVFFLIASGTADNFARTLPSYEKADLAPVLQKEEWSEADYDFLFRQTGLGKIAVDDIRRTSPADRLEAVFAEYQEALFFKGTIAHEEIVKSITYHDVLHDTDPETGASAPYYAPIVDRKAGDIIVTSSTHTLGYGHGHAAIMLRGGMMLQSVAIGFPSQRLDQTNTIAGIPYFQRSSNFLVLRLKEEYCAQFLEEYGDADNVRAAIADDAEECLYEVPYSLTVGVFHKKDQGRTPTATNCSHLVWQAYKNFGFDIDADGGLIVTPRDIAMSKYFDVVQVYGFDPLKLW